MSMTKNDIASIFSNIAEAGLASSTTLNGLPGMSSLEIAEVTGKSHKHVRRDIKRMLNEIGPHLGQCQFAETQAPDGYGRSQPLIVLDKELTFTVLTGYSATLRLLIMRRWLELEGVGFERVHVREAIVHLVEREKDNYRDAMRFIKRSPRSRGPAAKAHLSEKAEREKLGRLVRANMNAAGGQ
ncbi:Rha family transcriptional regulator [Pseudomonas sp. NFR16]|uniref:Rha family transcriptional regulator n=1 Tax=Pseudomonas sp. NFR16 TaxID=1566248 RepID=UPI0008C7AC95|nr:Rha family transcriptional regulator [Pseudomonas sp. NFR16]SEJ64491.1 Phage regulatory protein Rha [Pseudomonas sp. NFR16]